ncbi:hypothetical protein F0562_001975 [Nyssa sinensis]|uniref:RING-type E3 ubiquitin transferase n=1 Tax=Nyssa sinensis TaxID=561372 RepID=A0A5J5C9N0_9ASTE|nr:hypothetical protein F0562_001975 [Nyssa sinensis]
MKPHGRKLLQDTALLPSTTYSPDPYLQPNNGTSTAKRAFKPNTPFDSSVALTILVLLTALFFMGFFSICIRQFTDDGTVNIFRRRRNHVPPPQSSSSSLRPPRFHPPKGLDSSTVRSLPLISYGGDAKHRIDCAICLSEFEDRETVKSIPYCRHVFHPTCIDTWLYSHVSCPLCRSTQIFMVDEENGLGVVLQEEPDHRLRALAERSTVDGRDTWVEEGRDLGTLGLRRTGDA